MAILWAARVSSVVIWGSVGLKHLFLTFRKPGNGAYEEVTQAQSRKAPIPVGAQVLNPPLGLLAGNSTGRRLAATQPYL